MTTVEVLRAAVAVAMAAQQIADWRARKRRARREQFARRLAEVLQRAHGESPIRHRTP